MLCRKGGFHHGGGDDDEDEERAFCVERRLKGDMYSVGWVLAELWFEKQQPYKPAAMSGDAVPPRLDGLIQLCLNDDWKQRPSAKEALTTMKMARLEWWTMIARRIRAGTRALTNGR